DGVDEYPLYPIDPQARLGTFNASHDYGLVGGWILNASGTPLAADFSRLSIGATWNETGLNLIAKVPDNISRLALHLDMHDDGWFHGRDNVEVILGIDTASFYIRTWASEGAVIDELGVPMWDNETGYLAHFSSVVIPTTVDFESWDDGAYTGAKIRIPWNMTGTNTFGMAAWIDRFVTSPREPWLFEENVLVDIAVEGA
nr:hypothetical protein [Candidatus Sigynarchaeota archaeon]